MCLRVHVCVFMAHHASKHTVFKVRIDFHNIDFTRRYASSGIRGEKLFLGVEHVWKWGVRVEELAAGSAVLTVRAMSKKVVCWHFKSLHNYMFWLCNFSRFAGLPVNPKHPDTVAQVRRWALQILCRGLFLSTLSVSLRLAQFSHCHASRLILSVHRQAWSFHQRANLAHCVATGPQCVNVRWGR